MTETISNKILRNTIYNIIGRFWAILIGIFLTPYIISRIGIERFGIWAISGVVTGYFGLLDFGVGTAFVRYIADFYTQKKYKDINQIINTGFSLYFVFALAITAIFTIFLKPILIALNIPAQLQHEAAVVFLVGAALFGASNALSPFVAIQSGLQRMDISNKVAIVMSIINIIGTVYFLERGYGLVGLMMNNVMIFGISSAINIIVAYRLFSELKFRLFSFDVRIFKQLFHFGYRIQIAKISGMFTNQIDKVLIAYFLSVGLVTFYQLGSSIVYCAISIAGVLTSALMPAFSEINAMGNRPRLIEAYWRSTKYLCFFVMPIFIFLAISASDVMYMWIGSGYESSATVVRILAFAFLVNAIAQVPASVCASIAMPQLMATGSVIIIILTAVFSAIFIKLFGFYGAAWGALLAVNIGTIYFLTQLHVALKISTKNFTKIVFPFFISCFMAGIAVFAAGALMAFFGYASRASRPETILRFVAQGSIFVIAYIACINYTKPFNKDDISMLKDKVPVLGPIIAKLLARV